MQSISITTFVGCCVLCIAVTPCLAPAQLSPPSHATPGAPPSSALFSEEFLVCPEDSIVRLAHGFLLPASERVLLDGLVLGAGTEYTIDARFGLLTLHPGEITRARGGGDGFPAGIPRELAVSYQAFPFAFKDAYQRRIPVVRTDSVSGKQVLIGQPPPVRAFSFDELLGGSGLQKTGSIVRGFTLGSDRGLSLNSGFRMQMAGSLARDVSIVAALTDENSPIQPEGTTRTLQEVDQVFVEVRGRDMAATLGDFNLDVSGGEFGRLSRKLQGARAVASYESGGSRGDLMVTGASPRGKFTTNQFQGLDGVQGPYRLSGENNNRNIVIAAGTERVFINGVQMTRGDLTDYTIDYATGEVTFTPKRLITPASRITVDFEYTDRQYSRNLVAAQAGASFLNERLSVRTTFFREGDDENSPLDLSLSDADRSILRQAGTDRLKAVRSGVDSVGVGKGEYEALDTLVRITPSGRDSLVTIYRYNPADTLRAIYAVNFAYVGSGEGDYEPAAAPNQYRFSGVKLGSYAPVRFLPLPKGQMLTDFSVGGKVFDDLRLSGELSISDFDANRFSPLQDDANGGGATSFALAYAPDTIRLFGVDAGSAEMSVKHRFISRGYAPLDRINEVEFARNWNLTDSSRSDEEMREAVMAYHPSGSVTIGGSAGSIRRGGTFASDRYTGNVNLAPGGAQPGLGYRVELLRSHDDRQALTSRWIRHEGHADYRLGKLTPRLAYSGEVLRNSGLPPGSLAGQSFRYNEIAPGAALDSIAGMSFSGQVALRWEDSLSAGTLRPAASSVTQTYGWKLSGRDALSSAFDMTIRQKTSGDEFRRPAAESAPGLLLRSQTQFAPFSRGLESEFFYEVATGRSAKLQRIFQHVPRGTGSYVYAGDLNGNHAVDDEDFRLSRFDGDFVPVAVPTDALVPVTDLKASTRIRLAGERLFSHPASVLTSVLSLLSGESYLRVEEKSSEKDRKQIYFLHVGRFLSNQTTLNGASLVTQDIFVGENSPVASLRLRYSQRCGLTQYALADERIYAREQSVRLRWQLVPEFANQTDLVRRRDILTSDLSTTTHARDIAGTTLSTDWSYRPEHRLELGFRFSFGDAVNFDTTAAALNDQSARLLYSFNDRGQAKAVLTREEVVVDKAGISLPFELASGRVPGRSWLWQLRVDYRLTQFIQGSLNYDGRSEAGGPPVHTAKAEVRAFF